MKRFAKVVSLILVLCFVFSLAACGKQAAKIDGKWKYTADFEKILKAAKDSDELKESEEAQKALSVLDGPVGDLLKKLKPSVFVELKEDNTMVGSVDNDSLKSSLETLKAGLPDVLPAVMAILMDVSEEKAKEQIEDSGMSMEEMTETLMAQFNVDDMLKEATTENLEGTYRFEDGKLYFAEKGEKIDTSKYLEVELSSDTLKITGIKGLEEKDEKEVQAILPIELERVTENK